ncbi:MAG TPA: carbohydrate-binding protein, partial [Kofleriaceae bacterium]
MTNHSRLIVLFAALSLGACATDNSTATGEVTAEQCAAATSWQAWKPYATGAIVSYGANHYQCVQGHTSQPDWTPDAVAALWTPVTCSGGGGSGGGGDGSGSGSGSGSGGGGGGGGTAPAGLIFSAYKDTSINMDWNANVISTSVTGSRAPLVDDMTAHGAKTITLAFATGECGSENWGGVQGAAMASANVPLLTA